ncbi:MAG: hypothetical protein ACOCUQ_01110 [Bacteroidota bacterium]
MTTGIRLHSENFPFQWVVGIVVVFLASISLVWSSGVFKNTESISSKNIEIIVIKSNDNPDSLVQFYNRKGYLQVSIDSIAFENDQQKVVLRKGQRFYYKPGISDIPPVPDNFSRDQMEKKTILTFEQFDQLTNSILHAYANSGYPFARIDKQNIKLQDSVIHFDLKINPMEYTEFQGINITTDIKVNNRFLQRYLGIKKGEPYNEETLQRISNKIEALDFLDLEAPVELSFFPGQALVSLPLKRRSTNRFDGIAGISGGGNNEPLQINGILNLYLSNSLERGESFDIRWHAPGNTSQFLDINTQFPYPFGFPLETGFEFSLHKQDTTWIQIQARPSLRFNIKKNTYGGVFLDYTNNSLLEQSTNNNSTNLNAESLNIGFNSLLYGIKFEFITPGFHTNLLRKGMLLDIRSSAGNIQFSENSNANPNHNQNRISSFHMRNSLTFHKRWMVSNRSTFSLKTDFFLMPGKNFHRNQLTRSGGFQSLKGFDELSLLASGYLFNHLDLRYFTSPESFFSLFINGGWYESKTIISYYNEHPVGFGLGLHQQTQAGIFSLYFASGFSERQNFSLRNVKIHAGYISKF